MDQSAELGTQKLSRIREVFIAPSRGTLSWLRAIRHSIAERRELAGKQSNRATGGTDYSLQFTVRCDDHLRQAAFEFPASLAMLADQVHSA